MTTFGSELGDIPVSGNAGLRYVRTTVDSRGYRSAVTVTPSVGGSAATVVRGPAPCQEIEGTGGYDYCCPAQRELRPQRQTRLRFGASKAIARSGIEDFNVGITPVADATATTVQGVLANSTTGNPNLKPLESWNLDASLEFYVNRDTSFSFATYYKWIKNAAFDAEQPFTTSIIANGSAGHLQRRGAGQRPETRHLYGFEITGNYVFSFLPGVLVGFWARRRATTRRGGLRIPRPLDRRPLHGRRTCAACRSTTSTARSSGRAKSSVAAGLVPLPLRLFQAELEHQPQRRARAI
jgi:iron complex outermembrane receptor protein